MMAKAIRLRGIVQGVGMRPALWHLAKQYHLSGSVWNDGEGVMIHAFGSELELAGFIRQIPLQLPPLAKLDSLDVQSLDLLPDSAEFNIIASQQTGVDTLIPADAATCAACLAEIADPNNRRYGYAFTHCTHCGPRLSIINAMPYDRCHTSMAEFAMCGLCQQEYDNPADRRFHTQANCCPECGPKLWLQDRTGQRLDIDAVIAHAAKLIQQGNIIAIKGLGGFHLACDANNADAVRRLRTGKRRYAKAFALMAKNIDMIAQYAEVGELDALALQDKAAPIVLLAAQGAKLATDVAPGDDKLGFMLPYTPLHSLLLQELAYPIVLTSGNISDEPQCISNQDGYEKLLGIADYWLLHNRDIINRLDDSVVRTMAGDLRVLRRGRGYSPEALALPPGFEDADNILAMGAELKNSFCLLKNGLAIVSQHIGDLENAAVQQDYRLAIKLYLQLYAAQVDTVAVDWHPGYLSSQYGHELANRHQANVVTVQHHHAHLAAVLAEHGVGLSAAPVLAAVFDGLGFAENGQLWGGEFLLGDYQNCIRLGHFQAMALPGGSQAMLEPWRNAYAHLQHYFTWPDLQHRYGGLDIIKLLASKPLATLDSMIANQLNSPLSSSCGRWFDAFAAALGLHAERIQYEGQAAIALETLAAPAFALAQAYPQAYAIECQQDLLVLNWQGLWLAVLDDLKQGINNAQIAARLHQSLVSGSVALLLKLSASTATDCIVLTGGVFQNRLLLEGVSQQLQQQGKHVLIPSRYPLNDGGLALGQALIAAAQQPKIQHVA
ncbi:MAG: carbamoyltransferase HypF [Methylococcaceae bacterium]|jgi:hydrogenase maturation protein HypF